MYDLRVIVARNERAAGREAAHASKQGNVLLTNRIIDTATQGKSPDWLSFSAGYHEGREED